MDSKRYVADLMSALSAFSNKHYGSMKRCRQTRWVEIMSISNAVRICLVLFFGAALSSCTFSKLKDDLEQYDERGHEFNGSLGLEQIESDSLVLVAMRDHDGKDIYTFRMMAGPGDFLIKGQKKPLYFFAFDDQNKDLVFQRGEPYARNTPAGPVDPNAGSTDNIRIVIGDSISATDYPQGLVGVAINEWDNEMGLTLVIGDQTTLENPLFSEEQAKKGLWQPFAFMLDGGAGIHFLEDYDANRIPVIFVHGINGTPRNFTTLIEGLDRSRYQAWVYSYPSGLRLQDLAEGLFQFMETLERLHQFDEVHLIAHSLGGLVSRGAVNRCAQQKTCDYLRSYTTLSTPWNGVASAKSGVEWAPTVVPVWRDIDPDSEYVTTLFDTPLPDDLPYQLLFGFKRTSIFGSGSSDGVIVLASQLRNAAQEQAFTVRGYDEGHVSILSSDLVIAKVYEFLNANSN
jgi:pimeloyl-ACP methyl ester carboxylesterase